MFLRWLWLFGPGRVVGEGTSRPFLTQARVEAPAYRALTLGMGLESREELI